MAATDFVTPRFPIQGADFPVKNTSGSAIAAGALVKLDTSNPLSGAQPIVGVTPCTAITDFPLGFLVEALPVAGYGRCQLEGVAIAFAAGAVTAGAIVGPSATAGAVTAYTATDPSIGQALTAAASVNDPILVRIAPSRNA